MEAPFIYRRPCGNGSTEDAAIMAALEGDLGRLKGIVERLGKGNGDRAAVFSLKKGGVGVLHCAACAGHLEVCKYLVEELGGDANMTAAEGLSLSLSPYTNWQLSSMTIFFFEGHREGRESPT